MHLADRYRGGTAGASLVVHRGNSLYFLLNDTRRFGPADGFSMSRRFLHTHDAGYSMAASPPVGSSSPLTDVSENKDALRAQFEANGFVGPVGLFSRQECRRIRLLLEDVPPPMDWWKGHAVTSRVFFELGMHHAILNCVTQLIGDDVMLWGASLLRRRPGRVHPWHTDIETSGEKGGFVSVWIGLAQTNVRSSLQLVSHSHTFGRTVQEVAARAGKQREERTTDEVEAWARKHEPSSAVMQFDMSDGDALFFDGRLWHGSNNTNRRGERTALILQYAVPDRPVRIPDLSALEWPFRLQDTPTPPCIMVRGTGRSSSNRLVPPPLPERGSRPYISTFVRTLELPLQEDTSTGWRPYPIFRGPTACMTDLSCHVSVLSPGKMPHEPHAHDEEELLVVLSGEAELVIVDEQGSRRIERMEPGKFAYYPAQQLHTLRNSAGSPVTYLMFKWTSEYAGTASAPLTTTIFDYKPSPSARSAGGGGDPQTPAESNGEGHVGFTPQRIFEGPTRHLHKLQGHFTTLAPGHGYAPHVDAYDVAILTMTGTVETLGRKMGPRSVIFYAAGEPHGMKNVGDVPATYLVFEFHGAQNTPRLSVMRKRIGRTIIKPVAWLLRKGRAVVRPLLIHSRPIRRRQRAKFATGLSRRQRLNTPGDLMTRSSPQSSPRSAPRRRSQQ